MADGFIVRRGGKVSEQALAPTITKVSETDTSITFTLKNNDAETATLVYRVSSLTGDGESISVAADTTTSNITVSGLNRSSAITLFVTTNVTGKVKSNVAEVTYDALVYTAATGGTTNEYDDGGKRYKSHTFTSNGTFEVTTVGDADGDRNKVEYLIVAGGGGGGQSNQSGAGGGGGGGLLNNFITVTEKQYSITVGSGGAGTDTSGTTASSGDDSKIDNIIAEGGGGGGSFNASGANGGSGGGAGSSGSIGTGTTGQGNDGGTSSTSPDGGGGGGGAGGVGGNAGVTNAGGNGGAGLQFSLNNTAVRYSTGGVGTGGTDGDDSGTPATGGTSRGQSGVVNTGGGASARAANASDPITNGGSGIVVIRYEIAPTT
jgi:hypothetical protein